jgi:26S proteasome regulatory subunit N7
MVKPAYDLASTLYNCKYQQTFVKLIEFIDSVSNDIFINKLLGHFTMKMKTRAYAQLLGSYQSLSITTMASLFKVSEEYLEKDLSKYIVDGEIFCVIDRVGMVVYVCEKEVCKERIMVERGDVLCRMIKKHLRQ